MLNEIKLFILLLESSVLYLPNYVNRTW